jgi:hypothetical protein
LTFGLLRRGVPAMTQDCRPEDRLYVRRSEVEQDELRVPQSEERRRQLGLTP